MTFDEWVSFGYNQGFCGPIVCANHDGIPETFDEIDDRDMCVWIIRLYDGPDNKAAVEEAHSPSVWRAENER